MLCHSYYFKKMERHTQTDKGIRQLVSPKTSRRKEISLQIFKIIYDCKMKRIAKAYGLFFKSANILQV